MTAFRGPDNRRTYLRTDLNIPVRYLPVTPEEVSVRRFLTLRPYRVGILIDLSGGGVRMIVDPDIPTDSFIAVELALPTFDAPEVVFCSIIHRQLRLDGRTEVRARFEFIAQPVQDGIVKYIFERECGTARFPWSE